MWPMDHKDPALPTGRAVEPRDAAVDQWDSLRPQKEARCACASMRYAYSDSYKSLFFLLHDMIGLLPQILLCHHLHLMRIHCQERFAPDNAVCMRVSTYVMSQQAIACRLHQLHAPLYSMRVYWGLFGGTLLVSKELSPDNHHHKNLVQQSGKINKVDMVTTICRVHLRG